jgi:hypothetical protein
MIPYDPNNTFINVPVNMMFPSTHQCITAQIAYEPVPIQLGAGINDTNGLLAQRK